MDVGKADSEKMIHKFRTLESDLAHHSYNQNLEKLIGSFLKKINRSTDFFLKMYIISYDLECTSKAGHLRRPSRAFKRAQTLNQGTVV